MSSQSRPKRPENGLYQGHTARASVGNSISEAFRNTLVDSLGLRNVAAWRGGGARRGTRRRTVRVTVSDGSPARAGRRRRPRARAPVSYIARSRRPAAGPRGPRAPAMRLAPLAHALALAATAATDSAPARGTAALQAYNHTYCLTAPHNHFVHVDDGSLHACRQRCEQMKCPCFDYSTKVWALGKCRIVGSGVPFKLGSSCSGNDCETSFVPGGYHGLVPPPIPPPPPSPPLPPAPLPPPPPAGECVWDSATGTGASDTKTACHPNAPGIDLTTTLTGTHAAAPNVTHVDIQTIL
eukprot:COSAG02_NODE_15338_length_1180_cov_1.884366_1_plen_295_part_01